ncbi:hypothetical protein ACH3WN_26890 [Streptomyces albogriseolus]|uniref:hypothetical protein n=1 Tax=Streptomyces albogriseolus TaxID=1887 RepID=UPI003789FFFC
MSGDNYYFGDSVSIHGGLGHTGIVKNQAAPAETSPALEAAIQQLVELLTELRGQVPPARAQSIDEVLPDITSAGAEPQQRHRALLAVAGIAATVGAVGQPVVEAVNSVLALLGG